MNHFDNFLPISFFWQYGLGCNPGTSEPEVVLKPEEIVLNTQHLRYPNVNPGKVYVENGRRNIALDKSHRKVRDVEVEQERNRNKIKHISKVKKQVTQKKKLHQFWKFCIKMYHEKSFCCFQQTYILLKAHTIFNTPVWTFLVQRLFICGRIKIQITFKPLMSYYTLHAVLITHV